ncbi:MFS transporter [Halomonas sp. McH1-25]|uniref:MFS transporter n=1 Tax=unclassified Halomonas TaxID=2609666 RepID=UPI001EF66C5F|nr:MULTISPECIES: MFS transporter [unclassified Halomonas]MCG7600761.1 MFS transporter [Halomonas sp. McH1-25]MCP1342726.1 MFS transporter [Halomonas sp. FL8]MCP1361031.1 MFS transporter [Halomonas sp. BBD45]MCP1364694.1 MFS transporter [Halomonas sp. BBD48]
MSSARLPAATWWLILSGCTILMLSFGFRSSFGLFVQPLDAANGWGRDIIGLALAIQNLAWGVIAVIAGGLADRFGSVRVILGGTVLYALGLWLTAGVSDVWVLNAGAGLLVGAGVAGTAFGIVLPAMARVVDESRRQMVLGIGTAAGSMGQFLLAPVAQSLIDWLGWSGALNAMALMSLSMALLAMPLAASDRPAASAGQIVSPEAFRDTLKLARGHASYWLLTAGFFVCGFHLAFITVHMPPFLMDAGFDPDVAAWSISLIGLFNVAGAFLAGVVSGKVSKRLVLIGIYGGRAVAIALFMLIPLSLTTVLAFSCVMGFLWLATVPPTTGLVATMFGTRYMATLYGVVFLSHQLGSFTGVWLGGWLYETTGTYDVVWWAGVALSLVTMALHWPIRETPVSGIRPTAVA